MSQKINICKSRPSVACDYRSNLKPLTPEPGCRYPGECKDKVTMEVK